MIKNRRRLIVLKGKDKVRFIPSDKDYGVAEFLFCPVWKNGKIKELLIYPLQQKNIKHYYKIKCDSSESLSISSWTHLGIEEPKIWLIYYCKEHKTVEFRTYVPKNSNYFEFSVLSMNSIT